MDWSGICTNQLSDKGLFENEDHEERFREAVACYEKCPFFTSGLCKCLYLASWDMEHFMMILETLNGIVARHEKSLKDMRITGEQMAEEMSGEEKYIMKLSVAFLKGSSYWIKDTSGISEETMHIINQALKASILIDQIEEEFR